MMFGEVFSMLDALDELRWTRRDWLGAEIDANTPLFNAPVERGFRLLDRPPGQRVVEAAQEEWAQGIREPRGEPNRIDDYIRGAQGLAWPTADAVNWTQGAAYVRDGMFQWCGAFAAWCWGAAGLGSHIRRHSFASTVRLYEWGSKDRRVTVPGDLQPGDVVVVSRGVKRQGEHIAIVEHVDTAARLVHTIEGNAKGAGPDGAVYEGVIKRTRPWPIALGGTGLHGKCPVSGLAQSAEVVFGYRPRPSDLEK